MGLKVPKRLRKPGGLARSGVVGTSSKKMLVDVCIPTKRRISERRPDLVTIDKVAKRIVIYEVACSWDPGVTRREEQNLSQEAIMEIVREGQRETLCSAVRLVKRHMSLAD